MASPPQRKCPMVTQGCRSSEIITLIKKQHAIDLPSFSLWINKCKISFPKGKQYRAIKYPLQNGTITPFPSLNALMEMLLTKTADSCRQGSVHGPPLG